MTVNFSGLTNIPGKTIISPSPPPEPLDFYKDTTTNRITAPSTSFATSIPGSVVEDDLMILYHVTSEDVTQTLDNFYLLPLLNPGAESGTANWTNVINTLNYKSLPWSVVPPHSGDRFFWGEWSVEVLARQDIVLPTEAIPEIDAGSLSLDIGWWQRGDAWGGSQAELQVEFFDGLPGNSIQSKTLGGLATRPQSWGYRSFSVAVAPLTRTLRIYIHMVRYSGAQTTSYIDDITVNLIDSTALGWTPLWQNVQVADECTTSCYKKLASASEASTVTVGSTTPEQHVTFISNFGGVDTANPINAFNNGTNGSSSNNVIAPSVTTTQGSTMLYVLGAGGGYAEGGDVEPDHYNFTGGVTERAERVVSMDGQQTTLDLSVNAFPVTFVNSAQLDTSNKQSGNASLDTRLQASGTRVTVPDSPFWDLGDADFTVEAHVNLVGDFNHVAIVQRGSVNNTAKWGFGFTTGGQLTFGHDIFFTMTAAASLTGTGWHHVAICRFEGVFRLFTDGIVVATSGTIRNITTLNYPLYIARDPEQSIRVFNGWIDNVHVATGNFGGGRYDSNFTPPSGLPVADSFTRLLIPFDAPILPFGCKGAVGTEFIPFATVTGSRTIIQDKAQAAQSGTVAIARQL